MAYPTITIFQPSSGQAGTQIAVAQNGTLILATTCLSDDPAISGNNPVYARVISTPPTGGEPAVVVREAQMGTGATGVAPISGGVGVLGWLSSLYSVMTQVLAALGGAAGTYAAINIGHVPNTPIKGSAGTIQRIIVTQTQEGASAMVFTDGLGGPIIAAVPEGAALYWADKPGAVAQSAIIAVGGAQNPAVTVQYL